MVYSFTRIGAAIGMRVEDVYPQNRRLWVRLHEKGGKQHAMPCHHNLEAYLHEYIDGAALPGEPKALLCQTYSRATGQLTGNPLPQANANGKPRRPEQRRNLRGPRADGESDRRGAKMLGASCDRARPSEGPTRPGAVQATSCDDHKGDAEGRAGDGSGIARPRTVNGHNAPSSYGQAMA